MTYRLIAATPADEPWLDGLRRRVYADLFEATWGGWDEDRHARQFQACIQRGPISIIEVDGARVGMIQLLASDDSVEVAEIQVDRGHQRRGVGTSVLEGVISHARAHGRAVRLGVGLTNHEAIKLYERLGFVEVDRTETHCLMEVEA